MSRLIDADELIVIEFGGIKFVPKEFIDDAPTIEPERKKGKWKQGRCSECGYDWGKDAPIASVPNFCPNCGVDMREENNNEIPN